MNYMDFDPYLLRERNQQMLKEVWAIRCKERLRENGGGRASRLATLAEMAMRPMFRKVGLARQPTARTIQGPMAQNNEVQAEFISRGGDRT